MELKIRKHNWWTYLTWEQKQAFMSLPSLHRSRWEECSGRGGYEAQGKEMAQIQPHRWRREWVIAQEFSGSPGYAVHLHQLGKARDISNEFWQVKIQWRGLENVFLYLSFAHRGKQGLHFGLGSTGCIAGCHWQELSIPYSTAQAQGTHQFSLQSTWLTASHTHICT